MSDDANEMRVVITQLGLDVAALTIDRENRGVALPDPEAELNECIRLANTLRVEELEAIHTKLRRTHP